MNLTGIILAGGKSSRFGLNKLKIKADSVPLFMDQIFKLSFFCNEVIISTSKNNYPIVFSELKKIKTYREKYDLRKIEKYIKTNFKNIFPDIRIILDENDDDNPNAVNFMGAVRNHTNNGPIIGIHTSLKKASYFYSIIIAFDMPFISYNLLKLLIHDFNLDPRKTNNSKLTSIPGYYHKKKDAYIIKTIKGFEVLCGLYSKSCLDILKKNIEKQKYKIADIFNYLDIKIILDNQLELNGIDRLNFFNINRIQDYYKFKNLWQNKKTSSRKDNSFIDIWSCFFFR